MDVYEIEKIVRAGGSSSAESFHEYWPVLSNTDDVSETNTTLHLGHELIKAGFSVYAGHEFEMKGTESPSLDLLALNYKEKTQIRIKAKTDSDDTTTDDIHQGLKEIKSFQLEVDSNNYDYDHYSKNKFGIIICTSWNSAFIEWWENPSKVDSIKKSKVLTKKEEKIGDLIIHSIDRSNEGTSDCASGTYTLSHSEMGKANGEKKPTHGMQYLIFELNDEITELLP